MNFSAGRIEEIFGNIEGKRIAVVGDVMADQYFWGDVNRLSPEAPVPVVDVNSESVRLGGAANVAHNVATLGGVPLLFGVVGDDHYGLLIESMMRESGFQSDGILRDVSRQTTVKTRVIARGQHVVRFDKENTGDIDTIHIERLLAKIADVSEIVDGFILQDYNKGVITPLLIEGIVEMATRREIPVNVDPKYRNFFSYNNITVIKPNRRELESACGCKMQSDDDYELYGRDVLNRLQSRYLLVTRGSEGMTLVEDGGNVLHLPLLTKHKRVVDVSGAGDTVIASLTVMMAAGAKVTEAAELANVAAGLVCEEVGIVPVDSVKLYKSILSFLPETESKYNG